MKQDASHEEPREADLWTWATIGVILGGLQVALWWPVVREAMLGWPHHSMIRRPLPRTATGKIQHRILKCRLQTVASAKLPQSTACPMRSSPRPS